MTTWIYDCEVLAYDWTVVARNVTSSNEYLTIHNDNERVKDWLDTDPLLGGFNVKGYDQFILRAIYAGATNDEVKAVNDRIIKNGENGWDIIKEEFPKSYIKINQFDLMDDTQEGVSLKSIEGHLGMNITESTIPFDIDRPLTEDELQELLYYNKFDVDATYELYKLRYDYLKTKIFLAKEAGLDPLVALSKSNAQLTAMYLGAERREYTDEREYVFPDNIKYEYIPQDVIDFYKRLYDKSISDDDLFTSKLKFNIDRCEVTLGFGGIHGAIPVYSEQASIIRSIRNLDVASYYPHLITVNGYASRSMSDPKAYENTLERRMEAKASGNKALANALKLILNTTYGATLALFNDLYDPLMARSVCISGQLYLLELTNHLVAECPSIRVIQLNTDGIMVSINNDDLPKYEEIHKEWQKRTHFELEEDKIKKIIQKDVNNYIEIALNNSYKIKGGQLVRGIAPAGAFKINNDATIIAEAVIKYFTEGQTPDVTIGAETDPKKYMYIAKASGKYSRVYQLIDDREVDVQRCNRVYASWDVHNGTLYKVHRETGAVAKVAGLPPHCIVDNENYINIDMIYKPWYVRQAWKVIEAFSGKTIKLPNRRYINKSVNEIIDILKEI